MSPPDPSSPGRPGRPAPAPMRAQPAVDGAAAADSGPHGNADPDATRAGAGPLDLSKGADRDAPRTAGAARPGDSPTTGKVRAGLARRYAAERRFRAYGVVAIGGSLAFLAVLLISIVSKGLPAFSQTFVQLDVPVDLDTLGIDSVAAADPKQLRRANWNGAVKQALRERFPDVDGRSEKRALYGLVSTGAEYQLARRVASEPELIGSRVSLWVPADDEIGALVKRGQDLTDPASLQTRVDDVALGFAAELQDAGELDVRFNSTFFVNGDSRDPELAGIRVALVGSAYTLLITFALSFPIAVAAAIYLEEFAPQNRWTDLVEVNINNLAAVPSIVFGLLGLAVFINFFALPRSAPVVGGIVLSLMTLPTIIISSRAALKSVPPSIREAARGLGASDLQVVFHHVLPLAMPGILTGTIIGLAQALGETAPLLMIGMVAFIVDVPQGIFDSATVLPVQVYLWADSPERAFVEKTSAAIMVLLGFLIVMNAFAVLLRKRFERRW